MRLPYRHPAPGYQHGRFAGLVITRDNPPGWDASAARHPARPRHRPRAHLPYSRDAGHQASRASAGACTGHRALARCREGSTFWFDPIRPSASVLFFVLERDLHFGPVRGHFALFDHKILFDHLGDAQLSQRFCPRWRRSKRHCARAWRRGWTMWPRSAAR